MPCSTSQKAVLKVDNISKSYEGRPLLRGVSFTVAPGETVCLLGPSGGGKSTLLRIIAGLETAGSGDVFWDGASLASLPAHKRKFGLMFQDYALFPHLSVYENIAFGLRLQNYSQVQVAERVEKALRMVSMPGFAPRPVADLSGGEQQRVALARTLAPGPRLLMLDEPFGALDRTLRDHLLGELRLILRATAVPVIYVTHDQEEAFAIADRILILYAGEIVQSGTPSAVYAQPASGWVAEFLDLGNVIKARVISRRRFATGLGVLTGGCSHAHTKDEAVTLLLRPFALDKPVSQTANRLTGRVRDVVFQRDNLRVVLENGMYFYLARPPGIGRVIRFYLLPSEIQCLGKDNDTHDDSN